MQKRKCVYEAVRDLSAAGHSGEGERFEIINEEYPDGIKLDYVQVCAASICKKGAECEPGTARCKMLKSWADSARTSYFADDNGNVVMSVIEADGTETETVVYKRV